MDWNNGAENGGAGLVDQRDLNIYWDWWVEGGNAESEVVGGILVGRQRAR